MTGDDSAAPPPHRHSGDGEGRGRPWWTLTKYQSFLGGALVGAVGSWMLRTAQLLLVIELTDANGLLVGIVTAAQYAPTFLFSAFIGVRADRQSKASLLFLGQVVMIVTSLIQAALLVVGVDSWVVVAVLAAAFGVGAAIDGPMRTSVLPDLVPPESVPRAVSTNVVLLQLGRFVGPPLTAYLIVEASFAWSFTVAGVALIAFAVILPRLSVPPDPELVARSGGLSEAFAYLRRNPRIVAAFAIVGIGGLIGPNLVSLSALVVYRRYDGTATDVAIASTAIAIGALVGSLWAARTRHRSLAVVTIITVTLGVLSAASSLMPSMLLFFVLLGAAGCAGLAMVSQATAEVQRLVDDDVRGRVTGLYFIVLVAGAPIGAPLIGALGDVIGIEWAIAIAGAVVSLAAAAIYLFARRNR